MRGHVGREPAQRSREDVGEDEVVWRPFVQPRMAEARGRHAADSAAEAVRRDIFLSRHGCERVDVAGERARRPGGGGRHRQHPGAGADVGDAPGGEACPRQPVEGEEAALGRRVVAGAEGLRRLDLEPDPVRRHPAAVMAAENDEPARLDRGQLRADLRDPVPVLHPRDREVRRPVQAREQREPGDVGRPIEDPGHVPQPRPVIAVVEVARQRRRVELVEGVAQRARGRLAGNGAGGADQRHGRPPVDGRAYARPHARVKASGGRRTARH